MRRRRWSSQQLFVGLIGAVLAGSMLIALIAPGLATPPSASNDPIPPTFTPLPEGVTFPTPAPGTPEIESAGTYVHPSATLALLRPQGWTASPTNTGTVASVSMVNASAYSVVHAYIQQYDSAQDAATLDASTDAAALNDSWSEYDGWTETNRDQVDGRLVIDFDLQLVTNTYLARQIAWPAPDDLNTWAVVLRLVVPGNNPALLEALEDAVLPSVTILPDGFAAPLAWASHLDTTWGYALRYPFGWEVVGGGPGRTTTLVNESYTLTLDVAEDAALADEDAARAWVEADRAGADILAVEPVTRANGDGYAVAYTYANADGATLSGLAVLVNGPAERLYSANVLLGEGELDLLAEGARDEQADLWTMLDSFAPLPEAITNTVITQ